MFFFFVEPWRHKTPEFIEYNRQDQEQRTHDRYFKVGHEGLCNSRKYEGTLQGHYFYKRFHEKKKYFLLKVVGNNKSDANGYHTDKDPIS